MHADGQLLLLTGDVAAYSWAATPGGLPTFDQLFSGGSGATSMHLYDHGAGTRSD